MSAEREDHDRTTDPRSGRGERRASNTSLASTAGASSYDSIANEREDYFPQNSPRISHELDLRRVMSGSSTAGVGHSRSQSVGDLTRSHSISDITRSSNTRRRDKAAVGFACLNCKKAHLACDVARPCRRCVQMGRSATCADVPHKRRGRPRLRDAQQMSSGSVAASSSSAQLSDVPGSPRSSGFRGHSRTSSFNSPYPEYATPTMPAGIWSISQSRRHAAVSNSQGPLPGHVRSPSSPTKSLTLPSWPAPTSEPYRSISATLFVSINLTIIRALPDVQGFFCANPSVIEGRNIVELCQASERSRIPQLAQALQSDTRANKLLFGAQDHRQSLQADLQPYTNNDLSHPFPGAQEHLMTLTFVDALNRQIPSRLAAVIGSRSNDRFAYAIVSIQRQDQPTSPTTTRAQAGLSSPRSYISGPNSGVEFIARQAPPSIPPQISPTFNVRRSPNTYPNAATLPRSLPVVVERAPASMSLAYGGLVNVLPPLQNLGSERDLASMRPAICPDTAAADDDDDDDDNNNSTSRHDPRNDTTKGNRRQSPKRTSMSLSEMID